MSYNDYGNYNGYNQYPGGGNNPNGYPHGYSNGYPNGHPNGYQNRPPQRNSGNRRSKHSEKYRRAVANQRAVIGALALFFIAEIIVIALLATSFAKKSGKATDPMETAETTPFTMPTSTTTTETTPQYTVTEKLPPSSLADNYWGPLPVCESPKPYNHFEVKGLYTRAAVNLDKCIGIANNSEINSFVVDLKESEGIYFSTQNETAIQVGYTLHQFDLEKVVQKCHDANIYVIARIVCFKDPDYVTKFPDRAICDSAGNPLKFKNEGRNHLQVPTTRETGTIT